MKDLKEKLINESGNLENKAWDAYLIMRIKKQKMFLNF